VGTCGFPSPVSTDFSISFVATLRFFDSKNGQARRPRLTYVKTSLQDFDPSTIGSITKNFLQQFGISTQVWGPHSTRGAGVGLMKKLGLSADEVCEIGKWKSVDAFCAHYQRLGAQEKLEENLNLALACESGVHSQTSHRGSAEPDLSRTPLSPGDRGGRDKEGEAQTLCEVMPFCRLCCGLFVFAGLGFALP
jgi:hypothetical protein